VALPFARPVLSAVEGLRMLLAELMINQIGAFVKLAFANLQDPVCLMIGDVL
jgi:hypothetical protein